MTTQLSLECRVWQMVYKTLEGHGQDGTRRQSSELPPRRAGLPWVSWKKQIVQRTICLANRLAIKGRAFKRCRIASRRRVNSGAVALQAKQDREALQVFTACFVKYLLPTWPSNCPTLSQNQCPEKHFRPKTMLY